MVVVVLMALFFLAALTLFGIVRRTPVRGGATYREAHLAMEIIADHGRLLSFEIVEVNPVIDEHNRTADLAVELALSAFGKKIL